MLYHEYEIVTAARRSRDKPNELGLLQCLVAILAEDQGQAIGTTPDPWPFAIAGAAMFNRSQFYNATLPIADLGHEQVYVVPIPNTDAYQLINTAVWYTLQRLVPGVNTIVNSIDGGSCYYIGSGGIHIQLFVLRLSTRAAKVRVFPLYPIDPIEGVLWLHANRQRAVEVLAAVYLACAEQIQSFLREAAQLEDFYPAPPNTNDWEKILDWQDTYYPQLGDDEIERRFGISAKSLANTRSRLGRKKKKRARRRG